MDNQSIQHTRWNCTYHIVFIPKYRRKIMYGTNKKDLVEYKFPNLPEMYSPADWETYIVYAQRFCYNISVHITSI